MVVCVCACTCSLIHVRAQVCLRLQETWLLEGQGEQQCLNETARNRRCATAGPGGRLPAGSGEAAAEAPGSSSRRSLSHTGRNTDDTLGAGAQGAAVPRTTATPGTTQVLSASQGLGEDRSPYRAAVTSRSAHFLQNTCMCVLGLCVYIRCLCHPIRPAIIQVPCVLPSLGPYPLMFEHMWTAGNGGKRQSHC